MNIAEAVQQALGSGKPTIFFVNRLGENDSLSLREDYTSDEDIFVALQVQARYGGPYFEICSVVNGKVQASLIATSDIGLDEEKLTRAVKAAQEERTRFYTEREERFGKAAWPRRIAAFQ